MAVVAIAAMALIFGLRACSDTEATGRGFKAALKKIPEVAEKFKTGTITHTFVEEIPEIAPSHGDVLEVATSRSEETFTRKDSRNIFWDTVPLGTTVSEIRAPVTFRYHIRLSDPWRLAAKEKVCMVLAPPIRPSQPPAIHTDAMQKSTESGWARFNKAENLDTLEHSITPELEQRAADAAHMKLVREACRQSVADFVKKWLMREDYWRADRFSSITVIFPDEAQLMSDEQLEQFSYEPTIKLESAPPK
jgi:hypothetical protein